MNRLLKVGLVAATMFASVLTATVAAAQETIRFAVTDIDGMEALQADMGPFKDAFEKVSGLKVEFFAVSGRTVAVEAMAAEQVDFVLTGPAEYVVFNARMKAIPVVTWNRPDYYSNIVVLDGSPEQSVADLKGKKISFGEIGSTSQHLAPATLLAEGGLVYATDYEPVFLNRNVAVEALIKGEISAIGLNRTHIDSITEKFPDQKFRVLVKGPDLPNDVLLASPTVRPEVIETVRKAFAEHGPELLAAVTSQENNAKFLGGGFTPDVTDADYDQVRKMYENVGVTEFLAFLE
ncbi:PhnD/SsuA/transferrin family substrate-binding protein [Tabrizicola sp.]|uniref:PhnD/SsuA/transferrin family substrate-binding protein n=1 Tax=Tabrizicola sp. TaxID=2005166 RepID=UPI003F3D2281